MAMFIAALNSGSNGNCYYVGNREEAVLIDVGIPCREVEKRMKRLDLPISRIKAIFVSHEHGDHIHGVPAFSKKYKIPVYITNPTLAGTTLRIPEDLLSSFNAYMPVAIGRLTITAFPKNHDAADPHSFMVDFEGIRVGVLTDIGIACRHVVYHFQQCHAAFLEANYDHEMLMKGSYPVALKNRIKNGMGHLSNDQALKLFREHKPAFMSHLVLSHLSKHNNDPRLVENLFLPHSKGTRIEIASRHRETEVLTIEATELQGRQTNVRIPTIQHQLKLFE